MENNINAHCSICGTGYHNCTSCPDQSFIPWRSIVDTIEHYKIYLIIRDYVNGYSDKEKAKEQLSKCDLTGLDNFVVEVKNKINEIMTENKSVKTTRRNKNVNSIISDKMTDTL